MKIAPPNFVENTCVLVWQLIMLSFITDIILVTMVTILAGHFLLPSYQKWTIYKMEKLQVQLTYTIIINTSNEIVINPLSES
jgi:hypothetical protein